MTAAHTPEYRLELFLTNYKHKGDRVHSELYDVAKVLLTERDQLRQQVAELVGALSTMMRLPLEQVEGSGPDARDRIIKAADSARAILAKHAGGAA